MVTPAIPSGPPAPAGRPEPLWRHVAVALGFLLGMAVGGNVLAKELADVFAPQAYGLLQVVFQVAVLAPLIFGMELNAGLRYFAAQQRSGRSEVDVPQAVGLTLGLELCLYALMAGLLALSAGAIARLYGQAEAGYVLRLVCPFLVCVPLLGVQQALLNAHKRFVISSAQLVSQQLAPLAGALAGGLLSGGSVRAAALGYGLGVVGSVGLWVLLTHGRLRADFHLLRGATVVRKLLRYSLPVYVGELVKSGFQPLLILMVGLISLPQAGFVQIALTTVSPAFIVAFSLRIVAVPLIAERRGRREQRAMADDLVRWHNLMLLPVLVILASEGPNFIRWYYQPEFHEAAKYLPPLLVLLAGNSLVRIVSHVLMGLGRPEAYPKMVGLVVLVALPGMIWSVLTGRPASVTVWWVVAGWLAGGAVAFWLLGRHQVGIRWMPTFGWPTLLTAGIAAGVWVAEQALPSATWAVWAAGGILYILVARKLAQTGTVTEVSRPSHSVGGS